MEDSFPISSLMNLASGELDELPRALSRTEGFGCILVVKLPLGLAITPDGKTLFVAKYWRSHCGRVRSHTNTRSGGLRGRPQGMWPKEPATRTDNGVCARLSEEAADQRGDTSWVNCATRCTTPRSR